MLKRINILDVLKGGSKQDHFRFHVTCEVCGKRITGRKHGILRLFPQKYEKAKQRAARSLATAFNYCKGCGKWVCNDCYTITDQEDDMCIECAKEHRLTGMIVGSDAKNREKPFDFRKERE